MEQWIEILGKNGLAILVIFALGYFLYKKVWPLFEKRLSDADAKELEHMRAWREQGEKFAEALRLEREDNTRRFDEQGKMFMEALRTQNVLAAETATAQMKAQNQIAKTQGDIAQELKAINKHLKNGNGK